MAYVKISDPAIVDLATMQQIISVVNNHTEYLNALVNKFGATYNPDWTADDVQANFDIATSSVIYGKASLSPDDDDTTPGGTKYYHKAVTFDTGISFAEIPNVILTHNNTDGDVHGQLDVVVSLHNCTTTGFTLRAFRTGTNKDIVSDIEVNFIAFGRR